MTLLSQEYKSQLMQKHIAKPWGGGGASWVPHLESWNLFEGVKTVLDYGCGRHTFKMSMEDRHPEIDVREYDPGVPGFDGAPLPADLIVCTDVLEHFEPKYVDAGIGHLAALTKHRAFFVIACELSKSFLPDGRNTHLTVKSPDWWLEKLDDIYGADYARRVWEHRRSRLVVSLLRHPL